MSLTLSRSPKTRRRRRPPAPTLGPASSSGVKITGVTTFLLRIPPRQPTISDAQSRVEAVEFVAVRLDTNQDLTGWGFNWNYSRGTRAVKVMIDDVYAPLLIGQDPEYRKELCDRLLCATHFIGRVGAALVGVCAIEIALWDVHCKRLGMPLWRVLGPVRNRVKAYNTDGGWLSSSKDELVKGMVRLVERGFDRVKMKVGLPSPQDDYDRVKAVRKAIGEKIGLMVDVNTCWDLKTAMYWGRKLEEFRLDWLEEPLHPFDIRGHARLARVLTVPIAVGETVYTIDTFREYVEQDAAEILQADVTKLSGIDEWLEVAGLAAAFHRSVIPHTNVQQKLHAQLAAATAHVPMVEFCYESLAEIWKEPLSVIDGYYSLPEAPGVGCEFAPAIFNKFRVA